MWGRRLSKLALGETEDEQADTVSCWWQLVLSASIFILFTVLSLEEGIGKWQAAGFLVPRDGTQICFSSTSFLVGLETGRFGCCRTWDKKLGAVRSQGGQ